MAGNTSGRRPQNKARSRGEIDRYHYVDRDIYSRSDHRVSASPRKKRRKKKKGGAGRVVAVLLAVAAVRKSGGKGRKGVL